MPKRVTLKTIGDRLGLSQNTVSVALRGGSGVSDEVRQLVLLTAEELHYTAPTRTVKSSILIASTTESYSDTYFFAAFRHALTEKMQKWGCKTVSYHLTTVMSRHDVNLLLRQNAITGIVLLGDTSPDIVSMFTDSALPVLCCSFFCPGLPTGSVMEDNFTGIYLLIQHLYEHGYRRLGFIGNPSLHFSFLERWMSFQTICGQFALPIDPASCILDSPTDVPLGIEYMTGRLSEIRNMPEVFLCADDRTAVLAVKVLNSLELSIPGDVAITGFDNNEMAHLCTPTITTVDTDIEAQTAAAVWLLRNHMEQGAPFHQRIVLPSQLIEGGSVDLQHRDHRKSSS